MSDDHWLGTLQLAEPTTTATGTATVTTGWVQSATDVGRIWRWLGRTLRVLVFVAVVVLVAADVIWN